MRKSLIGEMTRPKTQRKKEKETGYAVYSIDIKSKEEGGGRKKGSRRMYA